MEGGPIEFELRSLVGVVAASVEERGITLLVLPDVDADVLRVVAAAIVAAHGVDAPVRVLGGMVNQPVDSGHRRRVAVGAIGALSSVGLLAGAAGVAAWTGVLPSKDRPEPRIAKLAVAPAPSSPAAHPTTGITVVPGAQPTWAEQQGAWPLPAALPAAPPATVQAVQIAVPPVRAIDPPIDKQPLVLPGTGPTTPASVPEIAPSADADRAGDVDTLDHPHPSGRVHFGWTNGPSHASERSSAATARRGGRR